jgi:hypothetical protein
VCNEVGTDVDRDDSDVTPYTLKLHHRYHKEDISLIVIHQHLSYHLMRHDASGRGPNFTLDAEICDIVIFGGCYNMPSAYIPETMQLMIKSRLMDMLKRLTLSLRC